MTLANFPATYPEVRTGSVDLGKVRPRSRYAMAKRAVDLTLIAASAPFVGALVGALALMIRLDGGNAFYGQVRLGKDGRPFTMWKLRTMVPDAEERLKLYLEQNEEARKEWEHSQKLHRDPRVTWLGRYLRRYSLDELPQLWNVMRGEMSLVGPRPMFAEQWRLYTGTAYFDALPGLTGTWQVSRRSDGSFEERVSYDTDYVSNISFRTDMRILARTVAVVFQGTGV